jgi:hypothetical protein
MVETTWPPLHLCTENLKFYFQQQPELIKFGRSTAANTGHLYKNDIAYFLNTRFLSEVEPPMDHRSDQPDNME